ncbi:MAG: hypothetical protein HQM10_08955 [Candidatus Riflebacteria bacterium]|nr:hypothetical protein [Candidatus Riflebacteria bacterium]
MKKEIMLAVFVLFILTLSPSFLMAQSSSDISKARQSLNNSLKETFENLFQGWETVYVDKPSFPYVVDKVAQQVYAQAKQMLDSNRRVASQVASKPQIRMHVMNAMAEAGLNTNVEDSVVEAICSKLKSNIANSNSFVDDYVTLAVVGWGNGDHESVKGWAPVAPAKAAERLIRGVSDYLK